MKLFVLGLMLIASSSAAIAGGEQVVGCSLLVKRM